MGFSTAMGTIASSAISYAQGLLGDFAGPIAVVFAITILGMIISQLRRFA